MPTRPRLRNEPPTNTTSPCATRGETTTDSGPPSVGEIVESSAIMDRVEGDPGTPVSYTPRSSDWSPPMNTIAPSRRLASPKRRKVSPFPGTVVLPSATTDATPVPVAIWYSPTWPLLPDPPNTRQPSPNVKRFGDSDANVPTPPGMALWFSISFFNAPSLVANRPKRVSVPLKSAPLNAISSPSASRKMIESIWPPVPGVGVVRVDDRLQRPARQRVDAVDLVVRADERYPAVAERRRLGEVLERGPARIGYRGRLVDDPGKGLAKGAVDERGDDERSSRDVGEGHGWMGPLRIGGTVEW